MSRLTFQLLVLLKKSAGRAYKPLWLLTGGGAETPFVSLVDGGKWGVLELSMGTISSWPLVVGASAGGHMLDSFCTIRTVFNAMEGVSGSVKPKNGRLR